MLQLAATFLAQKLVGKEKDIVLGNTTKQVCFGLGVYLFFFSRYLSTYLCLYPYLIYTYINIHTPTHFFWNSFVKSLLSEPPHPFQHLLPQVEKRLEERRKAKPRCRAPWVVTGQKSSCQMKVINFTQTYAFFNWDHRSMFAFLFTRCLKMVN